MLYLVNNFKFFLKKFILFCNIGGRTEGTTYVVQLTDSEINRGVKIRYLDIVSLYPSVQYFCRLYFFFYFTYFNCYLCRFPGRLHPKIIETSEIPNLGMNFSLETAKCYFGLFAVFLVPPDNLLFPIVPYRTREKTIFGLCRTA